MPVLGTFWCSRKAKHKERWVVVAKPEWACPVFKGKSTVKTQKRTILGAFFRSSLLEMWWEVGVHMREGAGHWHAFHVWKERDGEIVSMILEKEKKTYLVRCTY